MGDEKYRVGSETSTDVENISDLLEGASYKLVDSECPKCSKGLRAVNKRMVTQSGCSDLLVVMVGCASCNWSDLQTYTPEEETSVGGVVSIEGGSCPDCGYHDSYVGHIALEGQKSAEELSLLVQCISCGYTSKGSKVIIE